MFFEVFSRLTALTEPIVVPDGTGRVLDNTLLRHVFSAVVFPARAWHMIVVPEAVFRIVGHQTTWVRAANPAIVFQVPWTPPPLKRPITALRFFGNNSVSLFPEKALVTPPSVPCHACNH